MTTKKTRTPSQIGKANLAKSKAAEGAVVAYYRASGWPGAERTVRTGYRVPGRTSPDLGDIDGTPGITTQVKSYLDHTHGQVVTWLAETEAQRVAAGAEVGVLVVKRSGVGHPSGWWAYLRLDAVFSLMGGTSPLVSAAAPVRFVLGDLVPVLRAAGYGTPLTPAAPQSAQEAS